MRFPFWQREIGDAGGYTLPLHRLCAAGRGVPRAGWLPGSRKSAWSRASLRLS